MSSSPLYKAIKKATQAQLNALNAWDYTSLRAGRTEDFIFQAMPLSLNHPAMNNEQFKGLFDNMLTPMFKNFEIKPKWTNYDAENKKSVVYSEVHCTTSAGPGVCEIIQMWSLNSTGEKITRLDEFFDSKVYLDMIAEEQRAKGAEQ